ncbi:MAG TPA: hypothetical protein QGH09_06165 [Vicinamibacterales bacterium]|jgi:hypothetical protein|nr:hypothetical protein [Vicinamibacterales bacterium]|tara:strand:+ start:59587 stop:60459 length:873 start_codon:yes stop_codon:yes gene_type:complete
MVRLFWTALALGVAVSACTVPQPDPIASVKVMLDRNAAVLGSVVGMSFQFSILEEHVGLTENYRVFVHFVDADGEVMWTDDHNPPQPTSNWIPGQIVEYDRKVFLPMYPYIGTATIRVGLYSASGGERVALVGDDDGSLSYKGGTLELLPQSENVFLIFQDGWHDLEVMPDDHDMQWRWTMANATVSFRNPRSDVLLYLRADGRPDLVGGPQGVVLEIEGREVARFLIETTQAELREIPISQEQLGDQNIVELGIVVDGAFIPAERVEADNGDTRELGIRVFDILVDAHG